MMSHSVNKWGDMNVKLKSVTKCSDFSCERSSTSSGLFLDGHVHLPYYIAVVFQTVS